MGDNFRRASGPRAKNAGLEMLRGVAIGLVLLRHAWPATFGSAGIVGVVVFFALSGYLITGVLLKDIRTTGRVDFATFYWNRAIRLVPALLLFLMVLSVATLLWDPTGQRDTLWLALLIGITYTGNIPIPQGNSAIGHLWTLATEEQFYLVWPLILAAAVTRHRTVIALILTSAFIIAGLSLSLFVFRDDLTKVYGLPTSWALAMVIGAAARIWTDRISLVLPRKALARGTLGAALIAAIIAVGFVPGSKESPWVYFVMGPAIAILTVTLIHVWTDWRDLPSLTLWPLMRLGTISYAAYLWNYPIVVWFWPVGEWWVPLATIVLTIAAATASWFLVEKRMLGYKRQSAVASARPPSAEQSAR